MHLTLGIFLKLFKLFDQECRRFDYRVGNQSADEDLENILEDLFFKEEKVFNFDLALKECTTNFLYNMTNLEDEDVNKRTELERRYNEHRKKVEAIIQKLVRNTELFLTHVGSYLENSSFFSSSHFFYKKIEALIIGINVLCNQF